MKLDFGNDPLHALIKVALTGTSITKGSVRSRVSYMKRLFSVIFDMGIIQCSVAFSIILVEQISVDEHHGHLDHPGV